ncbi:MAG: F0F1 ATP synthase subunit B [Oscillospiraceae bacterium]|nr:F0F1 ATP synthase subunit B [Oscillospiraceae bacterium]
MELHPVDVIISIINIAVLFILLRLILWKPVISFLNKRSERVRQEMDDAAKSREDAQALHSEYVKKLGELQNEGAEIVRKSQLKANENSEKILKDARLEVSEMMRDAHARIEIDKKQALEEAHVEVTQLATEMASRILQREVKEADNTHVVDDFFK